MLQNAEYRMPLVKVDRGPSTLPVYLRRIDANLFVDFGGAFDKLDTSDIKFFTDGAIISSPQLQTSAGGELWFGTSLVYGIDTQFRLGYARGLGPGAIPDGQLYFVASNAY